MNLEQLNENRVEQALTKLANTDDDHAAWAGQVKYLEEAIKQAKAHSFLLADGTVAEREAKAIASPKYDEAVVAWTEALKTFKKIDNYRNHEIRIIDIWRTLSSNRRQGNM
jgi:hypothetical protein